MEGILDLYTEEYSAERPLVCMDETSKQLISETRRPIDAKPGKKRAIDHEYERNGTRNLFLFFSPSKQWRHVKVTKRRTKVDWAQAMKELSDKHFKEAEKIIVVMDNLNTHNGSSFYEAFEPEEARRLCNRFEFHYTPKHGSWLNMAEIELSVLGKQCLNRRIANPETLKKQVRAWQKRRNHCNCTINWRFKTVDARIKLKRLYPKINVC